MSAILAAMRAAHAACSHQCADHGMDGCMWCRPDGIGRAINRASNATQAGRVVRGAPRTWAVRWRPQAGLRIWWCDGDDVTRGRVDEPTTYDYRARTEFRVRPTWCPLSSLWLWSTAAAHDPRGCGMPRAGEVRR